MSEVKYLADGSPVLVIGDAPAQNTSTDGGATLTEVPHTFVAKLDVEAVDNDQLFGSAEEAEKVRSGGDEPVGVAATPPGEAVPARGDAQNADELQAQIDALAAENEALKAQQGQQAPEQQ